MADKPIYYSSEGKGPMYYGGGAGGGNYGRGPMYYGAGGSHYGTSAYGGTYGGGGMGYGGATPGGEDGSLIGTITFGRMTRVIAQRWLSVFVFQFIGLIIAFAVYRVSPTIYQASSEFTMDMRRASGRGTIAEQMPDLGNSYAEVFNTRISDWRSDKIVTRILQEYRSEHPASTVTDEEIIGILGGSKLELGRNSRIITITVRAKVPSLAADLANAYAQAIESFTDEENKLRCDKAVSQIHGNAEKTRREVEKLATQLRDFRTANKVDNLRSQRETVRQGLSKTTADVLALETEETQLVEFEKLLASVQKDPESFGLLASGVPRAQDIAEEFRAFQNAAGELTKYSVDFTDNHPQVVAAKVNLEVAKQRFLDAAARALQSGRSSLQVVRNRLVNLKNKQLDLRNELSNVEQKIVLAESGLGILEADYGVANRVLEELIMDENKARLEAETNNEIVRVGRPASIPSRPVLPNPTMIFGAGILLSLAAGIFFVLVLDNLEDTIVNLSDIEGRLALKVLAVLPHVRRKNREQVARYLIEDKYSRFAETVAGFRNLLDSPRYEAMSHCMLVISTQPGEGKTITSSSLAIAYTLAGKKTLHVDFDMRRPRLAHVWDVQIDTEHSFSHCMQKACETGAKPDFDSLVNHPAAINGLDVIVSLPPDGISPATILGSSVISDFFEWARAHYDRIIVDSPPFGIIGDVVSLAVAVDSVIIMCCPDRTHFKPIQYCARSLVEAGANILGVVVNDVEVSNSMAFSPTRHHGYSPQYGYNVYYSSARKRSADAADHQEEESAMLSELPEEVINGELTDEE